MTTYAVDLKRSHRFDENYQQLTYIGLELGNLRFTLELSDADRLTLIELIAGQREVMQVKLLGMGSLNIKTDGAKFVYVDPQVLKAREIGD